MKHIIIIALFVAMFAGCKKDEKKVGKVTFYQTEYDSYIPILVVDGKKIGNLTQSFDHDWPCNYSVKEQIRSLELSYGEHEYYIQNNDSSLVKFWVNSDCRKIEVKK